jgi:membrane protein YdbS with pleckstrin-like domain
MALAGWKDPMQPNPVPDSLPERRAVDAGEVDVWWGGYAGRTMLPVFVVCILVTALIASVARLLDWGQAQVRLSFYALTALLWIFLVGRCLYRSVAVTYRLTTRHLYVDRGFSYASFKVIEVSSIAKVDIDQDGLERRLGVGRVRLAINDPHHRPVVLEGVYEPDRLVAAIHRVRQRLALAPHDKPPS